MAKFGFKPYRRQMEESLGDKLNQQLENELKEAENMDDLFTFADYNAEDAERIGYSDYSYWGSTLRAFFQNKMAVFFLVVMVSVLLLKDMLPLL